MPPRLSLEQSQHMTILLAQREHERFVDFCEDCGFTYVDMVMMAASVCSTMMPKVTDDEREHPQDMWVMEPTTADAVPTPAMQLLVAYANDDRPMVQAHLGVIGQDPRSLAAALGELVKMAGDLLNIWIEQQREGEGERG